MRSFKRDITTCLLLCAVALGIAVVWGSPFISRTAHADVQQPQAQQLASQAVQPIEKPHPGTLKRVYPRRAIGF